MSTRPPLTRGFTVAEKRSVLFERVSLYMVALVAAIAAVISFIALTAVGRDAGIPQVPWLLPVAIDGFGIACSVGIVRSTSEGKPFRDRVSEWVGLLGALGLSVLGNIHHALDVGSAALPDYVKVAYATAIPLIVAYGIHVYGRAMTKGLSAHVFASDPDTLVVGGIARVGEESTAAAAAPRPPRAVRAERPAPAATPQPIAPSPAATAGPTRTAPPAVAPPASASPAVAAAPVTSTLEDTYQEYARLLDEARAAGAVRAGRGVEMSSPTIAERTGMDAGGIRKTIRPAWRQRYVGERTGVVLTDDGIEFLPQRPALALAASSEGNGS